MLSPDGGHPLGEGRKGRPNKEASVPVRAQVRDARRAIAALNASHRYAPQPARASGFGRDGWVGRRRESAVAPSLPPKSLPACQNREGGTAL